MKRILTWLLFISAIALVVFVIYTFRNKNTRPIYPWRYITPEISLIVEINNFQKAKTYLQTIEEPWAQNFVSLVKGLRNLEDKDAAALLGWDERTSTFLVVYPLQERDTPFELEEALEIIVDEKIKGNAMYNNIQLLHTVGAFGCVQNNCLLISNDRRLLESAIDFSTRDENISTIAQLAERVQTDNAIAFYGKWNNDEWMQLEPHASTESTWFYTGAIFTADSTATRFRSVLNASSKRVADYLPGGTISAEVWTFDTYNQLGAHHDRMITSSDELKYWDIAWKKMGDSCQCDMNEAMLNWRGGMQGTLIYAMEDMEIPVAFVDIIDSLSLYDYLTPVTQNVADGVLMFKDPATARRHLNTNVLVVPVYVVQAGGAAYFSESIDALTLIKMDIENNNTLQRSENLNEWMDADQSFLHYYNARYLSSIFPPSFQWFTQRAEAGAGNVSFQSHQVYIFDWYEGSAPLQPNEHSVETSAIATSEEILLPPVAETNIWSVKNHNTGEIETFTQLQDNSIILKSATGEKLWQAALPDQIVGDVTQVDIYKNNKLQMAFATKKAVYIIDRNGKSLANFPIKLRSEVTTGLSVLDYENNKNYRFLVGCTNGEVFNFSSNGQKTPGWKYAASAIPKTISYNKDGNKDQIIITYQSGEERIYKRNGTR